MRRDTLTRSDLDRLSFLLGRLKAGDASYAERNTFLDLISRSSPQTNHAVLNLLKSANFNSIDEFKRYHDQRSSKELWDALVSIGVAALIGYGLSQLFKK